jgi:hypothetical protein
MFMCWLWQSSKGARQVQCVCAYVETKKTKKQNKTKRKSWTVWEGQVVKLLSSFLSSFKRPLLRHILKAWRDKSMGWLCGKLRNLKQDCMYAARGDLS